MCCILLLASGVLMPRMAVLLFFLFLLKNVDRDVNSPCAEWHPRPHPHPHPTPHVRVKNICKAYNSIYPGSTYFFRVK